MDKVVEVPQPYPVTKVVERHVPVPQIVPVPEHVPVPYPVEKVVERRVPYPVLKEVCEVVLSP